MHRCRVLKRRAFKFSDTTAMTPADDDEVTKYEIEDLCDEIAGLLDPELSPPDEPNRKETLWGLWSRLEAALVRNDYPDISEAEAVGLARKHLAFAGLGDTDAESFIRDCRETGASWRAMRGFAARWSNDTL